LKLYDVPKRSENLQIQWQRDLPHEKKKLGGTLGELKRKTLKRNLKPKEVILILRSYDSKRFHGN